MPSTSSIGTDGYEQLPRNWPYQEGIEEISEPTESMLLLWEAQDAIYRTLDDGIKKGYRGEWKTEVCADEHLRHAYRHIQHAFGTESPRRRLEDLQHALCRIAMALWRDNNK